MTNSQSPPCVCVATGGTARPTCYYEGELICVCVCHIAEWENAFAFDLPTANDTWVCGHCDELTDRSHFRQGADGVMFHASADAPPSDETNQPQSFKRQPPAFDLIDMCDECGDDTQLVFPSALPTAPDFGEYQCPSCDHVQYAKLGEGGYA